MIIITLGDPLSINIELLAKCMNSLKDSNSKIVIIGSYWQWRYQNEELGLVPDEAFQIVKKWPIDVSGRVVFWDICPSNLEKKAEEMTEKERGQIAFRALEALKAFYLKGCAVITMPIDKAAIQTAGFLFPGQTEYCESLSSKHGIMILAGPRLKVGLVTNHLAINQISSHINQELIIDKIKLFDKSLKELFQVKNPKIAVTGLNPHCSDNGLFGNEEEKVIIPAIEKSRRLSITVTGPQPADSIFFKAYEGQYDGVLAMYHDQGLGPLKTVHFYDAANITGGLSFFRGSPDHGPARDLYLKDSARKDSLQELIRHVKRYLA